jgi:hypothetical protein
LSQKFKGKVWFLSRQTRQNLTTENTRGGAKNTDLKSNSLKSNAHCKSAHFESHPNIHEMTFSE